MWDIASSTVTRVATGETLQAREGHVSSECHESYVPALAIIETNEAFAVQALACCREFDIDAARSMGTPTVGYRYGSGGRTILKSEALTARCRPMTV